MRDYTLVNEPDSLCELLSREASVGIDTEFMRERTYSAELCLVQIATPDRIFCVDPLAGRPMAAFWEALLAPAWVLHSARQDLEVVIQAAGRLPGAIFDTQIAAGLVGFAPQTGYANLVRELFGADIAKSHTRADWAKRPLPEAALRYAAEDVEYLLPAHEKLRDLLEARGRLGWAEEDSAQLLDESLYRVDPATAIDRLRGAQNLRGHRRAAAARLSAWREYEAQRLNRPRQWIARDAVLIGLAKALPESIGALKRVEGVPPGLIRRAGPGLLEAIAEAAADDSYDERPAAPSEEQRRRLRAMQAAVAACAAELGIAAETLAPRKELAALVTGGEQCPRVLGGWRLEIIGERLLELLQEEQAARALD
jgi:ribonuclease D